VDALEVVGVVAVGVAAGFLSGMFGVGGAVLTTPGIRAMGATPIEAVGSTIPAILPGALTGAWRYSREGLVDWRIGGVCGGAGAVLAVGGAKASDLVDARWLMVLTAALLAWSGVSIIRRAQATAEPGGSAEPARSPGPGAVASRPGTVALAGVGAASGFVAGLLGVGGGVVMMPVFTTVLRIPVKVAVASSLVAVAVFSIPALATHAWLGHIDWPVALLLVVGTVPGALLGSKQTIARSEERVELLLGVFFLAVAVVFGGGELLSIARDAS
jgi:uncharacterized membrane protein YfcA